MLNPTSFLLTKVPGLCISQMENYENWNVTKGLKIATVDS